ncbi:molybdopterin oxidoreductase [Sphingomonas sp. DBB INV C78]|uniref:molybdopterin-dependent oxidoreductase n=1 Tax=Sphingomonas sp. DBB INV C78 TaxID=3349434 RepID=UPI0036D20BE8
MILSRRSLIGALAATPLLTGCDRLTESQGFRDGLRSAEGLTMRAQRLITDRTALAREFSETDLSPTFRPNGSRGPTSADYAAHAAAGFANWRLKVDGLVAQPLALSMAHLRRLPARTQITRHDCVEGWSAIGKWTGTPLALILHGAGVSSRARFIVFHCADEFGTVRYYESIDMVDALHPQTILAWGLNGKMLPIENGAPLRLRVERQLGYKHAKYVERIEAVESLAGIEGGKGGSWEDRSDYAWYAGI